MNASVDTYLEWTGDTSRDRSSNTTREESVNVYPTKYKVVKNQTNKHENRRNVMRCMLVLLLLLMLVLVLPVNVSLVGTLT
jgi:hypothetical protein